MNTQSYQQKLSIEIGIDKTPAELIDIIETHYHAHLRQIVPELIALAEKVARVHQAHEACPQELVEILIPLWEQIQFHLQKEENVLFPMIRAGQFEQAQLIAQGMTLEHNMQSEALKKIAKLREAKPLPETACRTWRTLFQTLQIFETELLEHMNLEDEVLLPALFIRNLSVPVVETSEDTIF